MLTIRTYIFAHKNTSISIIIDAESENEAWKILYDLVKDTYGFRLMDFDSPEDDK